ncbi:multidrug MFS transporter [Exiguobacterium sp. SH31]|uniref:MFS transporter n=1 Tax=unclassified Exiguobacterium TaxID=2644629 RepID=UPI0008CA0B99|nr:MULTISPECIES: MFS transporter [unclassified Exiguobacterium]OGX79042.1 multidrug MFS transporter [Exiguobacterium sp. SH31]TCI68555.1 MFS transporter [Exiguobacterium sp. SH0S7]
MQLTAQKLWTKDFLIISLVNFFLTLIFFLLMVTIGVHAVATYGATTSEAGLVTGIFIIGTLVGRLFIGRLIDSIGRRKTLLIGLTFFTATILLYFVDLGVGFLLFTRFVHGLGMGLSSTATGTIVAQIIPGARKGEGIGYYSMSSTLATAIGPFVGLLMSQYTSFSTIFIACLVVGVVSLVSALFVTIPEADHPEIVRGLSLKAFVEPKALPIALIIAIAALSFSSVLSYINFYATELDLVEAASVFFLVYSISVLLSRPITGRLMDARGANVVMYPAIFIFAVGLLVLSQATSALGLLLAGALIGLGFGNIQSGTQAIAVKSASPGRMGMATSTFFIALDAGLGFGPYFIGLLIPLTGFSTIYLLLAGVVTLTIFLYYVMNGRQERDRLKQAA